MSLDLQFTSWLSFTQLSIRVVIESKYSVQFLIAQLTAFSLNNTMYYLNFRTNKSYI